MTARSASADVVLFKDDAWEVYTAGRVNAFFSYSFGDAKPVTLNALKGGGVDSFTDAIPKLGPDGLPDGTQQGTVSKMRFRSGFVPNILTFGVRRKINETTKVKAEFSLWGTIEPGGQRKYNPITTDFRQGYLEVEGSWGTFTAGRFLSLFSRGITQTDFMYGHGYGLGFPGGGGLSGAGPAAGLIGFGVLAASFSPGLMYTTPSLSGFSIAAAIFDPVILPGSWETSRTARPEAEAMYDVVSGSFKMHLFVNGAYQKLHLPSKTDNETVRGVGYGGRFEFGPLHLGGGGHYGKGLGLYYALEGSEADVGAAALTFPLRTADGYSAFAQYAAGPFDINVAFGQSRIHLLESDKASDEAVSVIKTQTGISAGLVYHATENLHLDLDFLNGSFAWYKGEKQSVNYINTGVTMTW